MYRALTTLRSRTIHAASSARRPLCAAASDASTEKSSSSPLAQDEDSRRPRSRKRNETPYVKRRYDYRSAMHEERLKFLRGEGIGATPAQSQSVEQSVQSVAKSRDEQTVSKNETERARRREERYRAHLERLTAVQELKAPRQAAKAAIWEERTRSLKERREHEFAAVTAAAETWITEDSLDQAVEQAVDAFFIAGDAALHGETVRGGGL